MNLSTKFKKFVQKNNAKFMKNMKNIFIFLLIFLLSNGISQNNIDSIRANPLLRYRLESAKKYGSFYDVALVGLISCEDKDEIYKQMIEKSKKDIAFCTSLIKNFYLFRERHSYYDLFIHNNLQLVENLCDTCKLTLAKSGLDSLYIKNEIEFLYFAKKNINGKYDKLIKSLDTILFEDQYFRKIGHCLDGEDRSILINERNKIDRKNIFKIEEIIKEYNYLSKNEVGFLHEGTIFLVIRHQPDCVIRQKFIPFVEKLSKIPGNAGVDLESYLRGTKRICDSK